MSGRVSHLFIIASLVAVLSGCTASGFGSKRDAATDISIAPQPVAGAAPGAAAQPIGAAYVAGKCPQIVIRDEGAIFKAYAKGAKDDPSQLAYQASLVQGTRQCSTDGTALNMTIVVQGRLVAGPMGATGGSVNLPIKVSVMDGQTVLYSDTTNYQASLPAGDGSGQFLYTDSKIHVTGGAAGFVSVYASFEQAPTAPAKPTRTGHKKK